MIIELHDFWNNILTAVTNSADYIVLKITNQKFLIVYQFVY